MSELDQAANTLSRREFSAMTLAAGLAAASGAARAAAAEVVDTDVVIATPSGSCDAALVHPKGSGKWPAAILFCDAFGLRPTMRDMAKRLAADGYTVLVPNPYYRSTKAPGLDPDFDFSNPADRDKMMALRAPLTSEAVMQDSIAYVAYLDAQPSVNTQARMGAFGYCMGGAMMMQAAAANSGRIGAGGSFHGGALVTAKPDSPHLLVPKLKGEYYFGVAANDDEKEPDAKVRLGAAFQAAHIPAKIEVYAGCMHGWCVKDMKPASGKPVYNEAEAERAWSELVGLFKRAHV